MKKQIKNVPSKVAAQKSGTTVSDSRKFYENRPVFLKYCRLAWKNYLEHLSDFAKLSSKFTSKLADDELKALKKLEKMVQANDLTNFRADVHEDTEAMKLAFKSGVWYIKEAFPGNLRKLEEAGGIPDFSTLSSQGRERVMGYTTTFKAFLTKYRKELIANDNMPPSFPQEFNDTANRLQKSLQNLNNAESSFSNKIDELDEAFVERQTAMMKMLKAATEVIFQDNRELRRKFTVTNLQKMARVGEKTIFVGLVRVAVENKPIKNASITIIGSPQYSAVTNGAGKFRFEMEKHGTCKIKVKAPGYETHTITKVLNEGVQNRVFIYLTPMKDANANANAEASQPTPAKRSKKATADGVAA